MNKLPRKNPWVTALKISCWVVGCLILLCGIGLWCFTAYFSPQRITRLIENKSSEYLKADIKIGSIDYKIFSTYPWLKFEVDSLTIISESLKEMSPQQLALLPAYRDSLASVVKISGKINVHSLMHKKIKLKDIEVVRPVVNIVMVNDSVSNFNIVKKKLPKIKKAPKISLKEMNVESPVEIRFFSLQNDIEAGADIQSFYLTKYAKDYYQMAFEGKIDGRFGLYELPTSVPLGFSTSLKIDLPEITLWLKDLSLKLAGLNFSTTGEMMASANSLDIKEAEFNFSVDDIFELLNILPLQLKEKVTLPKGVSGKLPMNLKAKLEQPYKLCLNKIGRLNIEDLPAISGSLNVEDGNIAFQPPQGKLIFADGVTLNVIGNFNPMDAEETRLELKELKMFGEGISLYVTTEINNLTGEEQEFNGYMNFNSNLMRSLSYLLPKSSMKIAGHLKGDVNFSGLAINLGKNGVKNIRIGGDIETQSLDVKEKSIGTIRVKNLEGKYKAIVPSYPLTNYAGAKLDFGFDADSLISDNSSTKVILAGLDVKLDAYDTVSGSPIPEGTLLVNLKNLNAVNGNNVVAAKDIQFKTIGKLQASSNTNYTTVSGAVGTDDELIASRVEHTPLVLEYNGGSPLQTIMTMATLYTEAKVGNGHLETPDYLLPVEFSGIDLTTNLDNVRFKAGNISLGTTDFSMLGEIDGLKPFMTSYSATPLFVSMDIDFDNVDINQLSWGYYGALLKQGKSRDSVFYVPPMSPFKAADSVCVVIPRNITADIRLKSKAAEYMQYKFSPLSTDIQIENGDAILRNLTIGTPYCTAVVDWTYSTARLDDIYMKLRAEVRDFKFDSFYSVFPDLLEKAPELHNLTGNINSRIGCDFGMFPDMFMNSSSLKGRFDIQGTGLQFARQGKIEKITHLMLIEGDEPIEVQNLDIKGSYHDNLLELYPFKIRFDNYQLELGGVNNISGDMYYHIALEKSPFHLPFGVNVFGKIKHPEIRVGGTHINDYKAELVSEALNSNINLNIMAYLRHGWLLFIQEAAKWECDNQ